MQKVVISTKTADFKAGKYIDEKITAVVASTKSQNILLDELRSQGKVVSGVVVADLFVDDNKTTQALRKTFEEQGYTGEVLEALVKHAHKALNGACMFKRI